MSNLPKGWHQRTLAETCDILAGFGFPERLQGKASGDFPFYKVGDISETWKRGDTYLTTANHYLDHSEATEIRARPLPKNTTVFAKIGAAIALNRRAILSVPALVDNNVMGLHPATADLDPKFLFYFICTVKLDELSRATTVPSVRKSDIEQIKIPVPPLPEQRRIMAEIEKQFTRLGAGIAALRRTQANLKRYRAAVLKAACEGRLVPTEATQQSGSGVPPLGSRKKRQYPASTFETGEALLARILTERRQNWQGRGKYEEPAAPDVAELPKLPSGWSWARLEQLGVTYGGLTKNPKRARLPKQLPYLRVANVYANELRLEEIEYIGVADTELTKLLVRKGDLLIVEGNGSKDQIGRLAIWDGSIESCVHQNHLIKVRPVEALMSKWILHWLQSPGGRQIVELVASSTSGLFTLSVSKVGNLAIPVPPLAEQTRIVAEVERRLSVVEELETVVNTNLQRAARLRQSTLQRAFSTAVSKNLL